MFFVFHQNLQVDFDFNFLYRDDRFESSMSFITKGTKNYVS